MKLLTTSEIAARYVHRRELLERLCVSPAQFSKMMKAGTIPAPDLRPTSATMLWHTQTLKDAGFDLVSLGICEAPQNVEAAPRPDPFVAANEPYRVVKAPSRIYRRSPPRTISSDERRTALYRHFDSDGMLLYAGISLHPVSRLQEHFGQSAWAGSIATITVEWHETRQQALDAELRAIQTEHPMHNIVGRPEDEPLC